MTGIVRRGPPNDAPRISEAAALAAVAWYRVRPQLEDSISRRGG
jgi:hypothetical protein